MPPKFGTSGLRGLVTDLSDELCAAYTRAFLLACGRPAAVVIGRDLRPSSPRISAAVAAGAASLGVRVIDCGAVPTPALALAAFARHAPSVMVTGSHIPADRNGLKFYTALGEITKTDEAEITRRAALETAIPLAPAVTETDTTAGERYVDRYLGAFAPGALSGLHIGVYEHSAVIRDLLGAVLTRLGARITPLARSATFIPVDTEAVDPATRAALRTWASLHRLDAIVSADGDSDRPLVTDERGEVVPGDILGTLTAMFVGADTVATPVTSNSMVELSGAFAQVIRTRIGSPFVIAAMEEAARIPSRPPSRTPSRVVGFEPNGGFLLGFDAVLADRPLPRLLTRDSLLPLLATLTLARQRRLRLSALLATLPARRTASDRLENVATEPALAFVGTLSASDTARAGFFAGFGAEQTVDRTDGLRVTFADGLTLHLRPSGNAPDLRCYAEAETTAKAQATLAELLKRARRQGLCA